MPRSVGQTPFFNLLSTIYTETELLPTNMDRVAMGNILIRLQLVSTKISLHFQDPGHLQHAAFTATLGRAEKEMKKSKLNLTIAWTLPAVLNGQPSRTLHTTQLCRLTVPNRSAVRIQICERDAQKWMLIGNDAKIHSFALHW